MSIAYSGGTIINTTFTGATRADIATNIITQLLACGWTNVSGSSTDQVLKCVATSGGHQVAVRVYDPGSGTCARIALRNVSGSKISQDFYILPAAAKTFRIIANKYQFFCFAPGAPGARDAICAGQLITPSWLTSITLNSGFANGGAVSDADTTVHACYRSALSWLTNSGFSSTSGKFSGLYSDTLAETNSANLAIAASQIGCPRIPILFADPANSSGYRWADGTINISDAFLSYGQSGPGDEAKLIGQFSDAVVTSAELTLDSTVSLDGHTWFVLSSHIGGASVAGTPKGSLLIMVA